jgi:glycosyltransferase involved in cell wall biosynthesis
MAYLIFGDAFTFPEGDASTNRVYTYAKGFRANGVNVYVICFRNSYTVTSSGESEGISYFHPFGRTERSSSFIIRRFDALGKYYRTYRLFRDISGQGHIDAILCYTKQTGTQLFAYGLSRIFGSHLILERSEHPFKDYRNRVFEKVAGWIKVLMEIRFSDAIFCISDFLIQFYSKKGAKRGRLYIIPSTVDGSRFDGPFPSPVDYKYICYSGSLTKLKDGVDILINSFSKVAVNFPDIKLLLVGRADTAEDEKFFRDLVASLGLNDKVIFTGKLPRNDIPPYLCNAEALALARPRSIVADAGFPSKVSEYLASGKPVVVTKVGEIPEYLTDNESAFLSEPDSIDAFAKRMTFVLANRTYATEIGLKGKELAFSIFSYNYQAGRAIEFIESL